MNFLRRLPLSRLLLVCGLAVAIGISATALASAVGGGPTPPAKPLAEAIHGALTAESVQGVSANITYTNHLIEGASLAGAGGGDSAGGQAGELISSPLMTGASGRLWADKQHVRLELQSEKGDMQVIYDGHTVSIYDAATNTVYRYTPGQGEGGTPSAPAAKTPEQDGASGSGHEAPSVAKIEEAISHLRQHVNLSEATPTDVAGQPAYTVRVSPKEAGSLIGGAELSFDATHGLPLRAAVYSSTSSSPVMELAATEVSYGPVASSVFSFSPPASAKIVELTPPSGSGSGAGHKAADKNATKLTTSGSGVTGIAVLQSTVKPGSKSPSTIEGLPKVKINGATASELRTALGTILTFERSGVRYVVAGAVPSSTVEAFAKGL